MVDESKNKTPKSNFYLIGSEAEMKFKQSKIYAQRAQISNRSKTAQEERDVSNDVKERIQRQRNRKSMYECSPTNEDTSYMSSPDNIVKRVMRNTRKSQDRIKQAICLKLADSVKVSAKQQEEIKVVIGKKDTSNNNSAENSMVNSVLDTTMRTPLNVGSTTQIPPLKVNTESQRSLNDN